MTMPAHRLSRLATAAVGFAVGTALTVGLVGPGQAADARPAGARERAHARAVLSAASALFHADPTPTARSSGRGDATLLLRDLALAVPDLGRTGRAKAARILARPTDPTASDYWGDLGARRGRKTCTASFCVHWTGAGINAPPPRDRDRDGVPNQVERTVAVMANVWRVEVRRMGFRAPITDQRASIDNRDRRFDVYLSDLGAGFYGYCAPDDTRLSPRSTYQFFDVAAYCVLDNDFSRAQFPSHTPLQNLQVTAAHEFNHAVQFGYDVTEDRWVMESTSTWIEDVVYDDVNDNRQYLVASNNLIRPNEPLDRGQAPQWYGNWIFLRALSEQFGGTVVRQVWQRLDGARGGPDDYSVRGINNVLLAKGTSLPAEYARFAAWNQAPAAFYSEGGAYPSAPNGTITATGAGTVRNRVLDHLTSSSTVVQAPADAVDGDQVVVDIQAPRPGDGGRARLVTIPATGPALIEPIPLAQNGTGSRTLTVDAGNPTSWTVVLSNGSWQAAKGTCFRRLSQFSCGGGQPLNENVAVSVTATLAP